LKNPTTGELSSDPTQMLSNVHTFYTSLYTPDPVNSESLDRMLSTIPDSDTITEEETATLSESFILDEILEGVSRCPKQSSPGKTACHMNF
jgi:hypothetical protein